MTPGLAIDPALYDEGFEKNCGPHRCTAQCCSEGVFLSREEHRTILQYADQVIEKLDESQTADIGSWFEPEQRDDDYPDGTCVGTRVLNGKCVFLNKEKLCVLQTVTPQGREQAWGLKPFYCRLYPITVEKKRITFERNGAREPSCCSVAPRYAKSIIEVCRGELTQIVGENGYRVLLEELGNRQRDSRRSREGV